MILTHWLITLVFAQLWMLLAWLMYRHVGNPMIADVAWGLGIMLLSWLHVLFFPVDRYHLIALAMVSCWGLRLSAYLYWTRLRQHWHDKRYQALEERSHNLFINYQIQGFLQSIIAIPWFFIGANHIGICFYLGSIIFFMGFFIECLADSQLKTFKKNHPQQLCNSGLWQYSRHPNYFGEILIWIGFAILGVSSHWGVLGAISPIGLILLMRFITGPLTEETSIQSRGKAYLDYQKSTPMIAPDLKKYLQSHFIS